MNHHDQACNDLLRKRNNLIATLESEIRDSDDQYKTLIEEFHENTSVLAARMEHQVRQFHGHFMNSFCTIIFTLIFLVYGVEQRF